MDTSTVQQKRSFSPSENHDDEVVGDAPTQTCATPESPEQATVERSSPPGPTTAGGLNFDTLPPVPHAYKDADSEQYTPRSKSRSISPASSSSVAANEPLADTHAQPLRLKLLKNKIKTPDDDTFSISSTTTSTSRGSEERTKPFERSPAEGTKLATELFFGSEMASAAMESSQVPGTSPDSAETPQILVRAATSSSIVAETTSSSHIRGALQPLRELRERLGIPSQDKRYPTQHGQKPKVALSISSGTKTDIVFPSKIRVDVHLRFNGQSGMFSPRVIKDFEWTVPASYNDLNPDKTIDKHVQAHSELKDQEIYIRHGSCQVKGPSNMKTDGEFSKVDDIEALNQYAIRDICGFISKNLFYLPRLEVHWDFSSARLKPLPQQDFAETIQLGLQKKMCRNFKGQEYIPGCDLEVFLDVSVARVLLDQDASLNMNQTEKTKFLKKLQTLPARKLLVLCVCVGFKLDKLKHLIYDHGFSDRNLPRRDTECSDADCTNKYALLWAHIHAFFPKTIKKGRKWHSLTTDKVVPLQHPVSQKPELGQGAFGVVTQVIIDRSHHSLSGVSNGTVHARRVVNNNFRIPIVFLP